MVSGRLNKALNGYIQVPQYGVLKDAQRLDNIDAEKTFTALWKIGGNQGWYYANFLWKIRGYLDQLSGGVGLRRGRTHPDKIYAGDALDFWRVLLADKKGKRLDRGVGKWKIKKKIVGLSFELSIWRPSEFNFC